MRRLQFLVIDLCGRPVCRRLRHAAVKLEFDAVNIH